MGRKAQLQLSWDLVRKRPSTEQKAAECEARDRPYTHTPTMHTHATLCRRRVTVRHVTCCAYPHPHAYMHPHRAHTYTPIMHTHLPCTHTSPSCTPLPPSCTPTPTGHMYTPIVHTHLPCTRTLPSCTHTPAVHTHAPSSVCVCRLHWVSPEFPKCQHGLPLQSGPPTGRQEECGHQGEVKTHKGSQLHLSV